MDVHNKIVIITGASSGIGQSTAELLSQKGAKVALVARSEDKLKALSEKLPNSQSFPADMSVPDQIKDMIKAVLDRYGRIDILINNAGQGYDAPIEKINANKYQRLFDLNLLGPLIAMQEVIPIMRTQESGVVVNISSGTALMYLPFMGAYSSLKRALVGLSLTAREELKNNNIIVSLVYPYITQTDFEKNTLKEEAISLTSQEGERMSEGDSPEYVAEKILEAIQTGKSEIYAHDWMKPKKS